MPSYGWYRCKQRMLFGAWIICTLGTGGLSAFSPWPWYLRAGGLVGALVMLYLLLYDWSDDRQEDRARAEYAEAVSRWRWDT